MKSAWEVGVMGTSEGSLLERPIERRGFVRSCLLQPAVRESSRVCSIIASMRAECHLPPWSCRNNLDLTIHWLSVHENIQETECAYKEVACP